MSDEFTFIIHGNYDPTHVNMCEELQRFGKVILSTNKRYLADVLEHVHKYDKIVFHDDVNTDSIYNHNNIYLHVTSVLDGLSCCESKYVVKFRSNHSYSNIQYIVDKVRTNTTNKFLCSNITINPIYPYHPCDTIIAGTYDLMKSVFNIAKNSILNQDLKYEDIDMQLCSEVLLFVSYLKYKNIQIDKTNGGVYFYYDDYQRNNSRFYLFVNKKYPDIIKENLELIDAEQLSPYVLNFNNKNVKYTNDIHTVDDLLRRRPFPLHL
jgi:hypothetical protein